MMLLDNFHTCNNNSCLQDDWKGKLVELMLPWQPKTTAESPNQIQVYWLDKMNIISILAEMYTPF